MLSFKSKAVKLSLLGLSVAAVLAVVLVIWVIPGKAHKTVNSNIFGVAIKGYDTVAYFKEGRAVKGKSEFEFTWQDGRWRFFSAANRDLFASNPERYAPQYGGF
jgi:hypothetical protein